MNIALLGELEVLDAENESVLLTGAKLRSLLVVLALHAGRVVPGDQLIEALWGQDPPLAVRNGLQGLVSKLRRALGSTDLVVMRAGGYVLEVPQETVDVHRYELLVSEGRAAAVGGDPRRAISLLTDADLLWRGNVLAEFSYEEFALAAITRLSELRLAAVEERLDAELHVGGRHQGVIGELEALVALRDQGNSIVLVEHDLAVVARCDWVIDLGPDAGDAGGRIVATGIPSDVARAKNSVTAPFLARVLRG